MCKNAAKNVFSYCERHNVVSYCFHRKEDILSEMKKERVKYIRDREKNCCQWTEGGKPKGQQEVLAGPETCVPLYNETSGSCNHTPHSLIPGPCFQIQPKITIVGIDVENEVK